MGHTGRGHGYFNPLSPHGERPLAHVLGVWLNQFQPTLPARGETHVRGKCLGFHVISTHSPRTGRDQYAPLQDANHQYFNPLSPHGERRNRRRRFDANHNFNPLSPHGERRYGCVSIHSPANFNPLSPHGERRYDEDRGHKPEDFNPLSPHGERHAPEQSPFPIPVFQPTLPARGETARAGIPSRIPKRFQPTLPARGETLLEMSQQVYA